MIKYILKQITTILKGRTETIKNADKTALAY